MRIDGDPSALVVLQDRLVDPASADDHRGWTPPNCPDPLESAVLLLKLIKHAAGLGLPGATAARFQRTREWAAEHSWTDAQRAAVDSVQFE